MSSLYLTRYQACNFIKKETLAQVFSCEFCKIFKNTFFYRTHPVAASIPLEPKFRMFIINGYYTKSKRL